jgi:glyoxylase-like metal-dependent hydrolase (beta-lactamase superfamily II)
MNKNRFHLLDMGHFYADAGAMFGTVPRKAWSRKYPENTPGYCTLAMHAAVVTTSSGRVIVVDTGVGEKQLEKLKKTSYQFHQLQNITNALETLQISTDMVTDVILTHLHFDHCGDATKITNGIVLPTFTNAQYWTTKKQWENSLNPHPLEEDSYCPENMGCVEKNGQLKCIEHDCKIDDQVQLRIFDGHTTGQIVPYMTLNEDRVVFAGDVVPLASHTALKWIAAYDVNPLISYD